MLPYPQTSGKIHIIRLPWFCPGVLICDVLDTASKMYIPSSKIDYYTEHKSLYLVIMSM